MGIDIRDGPQLECIQCALCIDACDDIMTKVGRPTGLIAYATFRNLNDPNAGPRDGLRIFRTRTMLYTGLMAVVAAIMLWAMSNRSILDVSILPDRNPLFVVLSDGSLRNNYTVKILNKLHDVRRFRLTAEGLPGAGLAISGFEHDDPIIDVVPDNLRALKLHVTVPVAALPKLAPDPTPFRITVTDIADGTETHRDTTFRSPAR
jgi:polyferredoxin